MDKGERKAKIELDLRQLSYFLGLMEMDIRYSKDKKNLKKVKELFNYFKTETDKLNQKGKSLTKNKIARVLIRF